MVLASADERPEDLVRTEFSEDMCYAFENHPRIAKGIDASYVVGRTIGQLAVAGALAYAMFH